MSSPGPVSTVNRGSQLAGQLVGFRVKVNILSQYASLVRSCSRMFCLQAVGLPSTLFRGGPDGKYLIYPARVPSVPVECAVCATIH